MKDESVRPLTVLNVSSASLAKNSGTLSRSHAHRRGLRSSFSSVPCFIFILLLSEVAANHHSRSAESCNVEVFGDFDRCSISVIYDPLKGQRLSLTEDIMYKI